MQYSLKVTVIVVLVAIL